MPYNAAIPQASDKLKNSQPQLLNNFGAINTVVSVNHVTFDDPSGDQGKHKFVTLPQQGSSPGTAASEVNLYNKLTGGVNELFVKVGNDPEFPVTQSGGPSGLGVAGWAYLPSGQKLKWGSGNTGASSQVSINVSANPGGSPAITGIQSVQITPINNNGSFWVTAVSTGNITVRSAAANATFTYLVIGQ